MSPPKWALALPWPLIEKVCQKYAKIHTYNGASTLTARNWNFVRCCCCCCCWTCKLLLLLLICTTVRRMKKNAPCTLSCSLSLALSLLHVLLHTRLLCALIHFLLRVARAFSAFIFYFDCDVSVDTGNDIFAQTHTRTLTRSGGFAVGQRICCCCLGRRRRAGGRAEV